MNLLSVSNMNILCTICKKTAGAEDSPDLTATICGHVFHTKCLITSIQSGHTNCQECGRKVKVTTSQRLYLNIVQTDSLALSNETFLNLYKTKLELEHLKGVQKNKITDLECLLSSLTYKNQRLEKEAKEMKQQMAAKDFKFAKVALKISFYSFVSGSIATLICRYVLIKK